MPRMFCHRAGDGTVGLELGGNNERKEVCFLASVAYGLAGRACFSWRLGESNTLRGLGRKGSIGDRRVVV